MKFDLHLHTEQSFDGFSTVKEVEKARRLFGIDFLGITEHDTIRFSDRFTSDHYISGCEFTASSGVHIVGLFLSGSGVVPSMSALEIVEYIKEQKGLVLIPHPFKPGSGLMANNTEIEKQNVLLQADLIELYNGGFTNSPDEHEEVKAISDQYKLAMLANSDSHKITHVGFYITELFVDPSKSLSENLKTSERRFYVDENRRHLLARRDSAKKKIMRSALYRYVLKFVARSVRRKIKLINYARSSKNISAPKYSLLSV